MVDLRNVLRAVVLGSALFFSSEGFVGACQICVSYPEKSAADHLIASEVVVLAREDPDRPFHFRSVEVLKGDPGSEKIDLFLNSSTRRMLAVYPERAAVLGRHTVEGKSIWRSIGIADPTFGPLVRELLKAAPEWEKEPQQRIAFFSRFLGHESSQLSSLALLEVARAPYHEIRKLGGVLSRDQIHEFLKNMRYLEWHALYILLLAQSGDERDREHILNAFHSAARFGSTVQVAAWATAAIEIDGIEAVEFIETRYFRNPGRSAKELSEISKALSVQGTSGPPALRDRIVVSYGALIALHPGMIPQIAEDLIAWDRAEYAAEVGRFAAANPLSLDLPTTLRLRAYARRAQKNQR